MSGIAAQHSWLDVGLEVLGMLVITGLLAAIIWPADSRFSRVMCLVAAVTMFVLLLEHTS